MESNFAIGAIASPPRLAYAIHSSTIDGRHFEGKKKSSSFMPVDSLPEIADHGRSDEKIEASVLRAPL